MKRSKAVVLTMMVVSLSACCAEDCDGEKPAQATIDPEPVGKRFCVDDKGTVLPEEKCAGLDEAIADGKAAPEPSALPAVSASGSALALMPAPGSSGSAAASASASASASPPAPSGSVALVASAGGPSASGTYGPPPPPQVVTEREVVREYHSTEVHEYHDHYSHPHVFWYYHPSPVIVYQPGMVVSGGSFNAAPTRSYASPGGRVVSGSSTPGVARGMMGRSFSGGASVGA